MTSRRIKILEKSGWVVLTRIGTTAFWPRSYRGREDPRALLQSYRAKCAVFFNRIKLGHLWRKFPHLLQHFAQNPELDFEGTGSNHEIEALLVVVLDNEERNRQDSANVVGSCVSNYASVRACPATYESLPKFSVR